MLAQKIILGVLGGLLGLVIAYVLFLILITAFVPKKECEKVSPVHRFALNVTVFFILLFSRVKVKVINKTKLNFKNSL